MIVQLPVTELLLANLPLDPNDPREVIPAEVAENGIELRVDWDGQPASTGSFEVKGEYETWTPCTRVDTCGVNDIVSPNKTVEGTKFMARVARGPDNPSYSFELRAIPITWKHERPGVLASDAVVRRDEDYECDASPVEWRKSALVDGVQRVILELTIGTDYEMWIRLQSPHDPDNWLTQDPIVRTDNGGNNGNN
ncbi:MAG: hypothetical protein MJE77_08895 [Proteobacteria bacterium]|nr:hypothetical protein [Pseudomonadota bacterium]